MKHKKQLTKLVTILILGTVILACSDGDDMSNDLLSTDMAEMEIVQSMKIAFNGSFVSTGHPTSGTVEVVEGKHELLFKNFKTDDGPDLDVYLCTTIDATDFVNAGDLKGIEGDYSYTIPADTDLTKYKYVVIWCVDFSVSFGYAELKMP